MKIDFERGCGTTQSEEENNDSEAGCENGGVVERSPSVDSDDTEPAVEPAAVVPPCENDQKAGIPCHLPFHDDSPHLQPRPQQEVIPDSEELCGLISAGELDGQSEKWTLDVGDVYGESYSPYVCAESEGKAHGSVVEGEVEGKTLEEEDSYSFEKNVGYSTGPFLNGDTDCVGEAHPYDSDVMKNLRLENLTLEQNRDDVGASLNSSVIDEDQPCHKLCVSETDSLFVGEGDSLFVGEADRLDVGGADSPFMDDRASSEASPATESLNTSRTTSPASSPHHYRHLSGSGSSTASSATGIPLQQGHPGVAPTCFVRVHPMHVAAAVAAQHGRSAAAAAHQRNLMAAAAARQHAAVVAQQRMAAAAAVHQRSQAAMMQQHLVRSRYVGAPVVVRPPAFVPAVPTGIVAPVRNCGSSVQDPVLSCALVKVGKELIQGDVQKGPARTS
ncbi:hypothetical protein ACOMHN_020055 [Nucella lapillus]